MITLTQTENNTLSLSANIRPKGYEGAEFAPEGLTVEVVGRNNGALLQHLKGNIEGDRLSVDIDLDDVQDVDIYDLVINYRLRDARYIRGYRSVNIVETAFEARRSENTSILGGGNTARATVITAVASEGANAGAGQALDLANLSPEQVEALKQALGISETAGSGQALDINALLMAMMNLDELGLHLGPNRASYLFNGMAPTLGMALYNIAAKFEELYSIIGRMGESLGQIDYIRNRVDRLESNLS